MSIKPPIKCPPDYSILNFRLTECKKAGIVKGIETQLAMDLQDLFVPVSNYEQRMITLKAGETKQIDISGIGENWPLKETYEFLFDPDNLVIGTDHRYDLYDENLNLIASLPFSITNNYPTFTLALNNALSNTPAGLIISPKVTFNLANFGTGSIEATSTTKLTKYRHVWTFDISGFGGYPQGGYVHPGNLIVPNEKYPRKRVKLMLIYPQFYKANIYSGCGCTDSSGDLKSNVKYIEYAFDDDYYRINNPITPVTATPIIPPTPNTLPNGVQWNWDFTSKDHIGYHFKNGDLLSASGDNLLRGLVGNLDGYYFETDVEVGDNNSGQTLSHVWSPNSVTWRKMGDFYLHTTAQDVTDTDYLYIETLWLRNPHQFDLPIKIMLAS
jgi:hypothetical protein